MSEMIIVLPECSDDEVSSGLRYLTQVLATNGIDKASGMLGGEFGYGCDYENDTFMLHPFCWCDRDDCPWCAGCYCPDEATRYFLADGTEVEDIDVFFDAGGYRTGRSENVAELLCDFCTGRRKPAPNFLHKPSRSSVHWYKYIGRGMEIDARMPWHSILADCLASLGAAVDLGGVQ